MPVSTSGFGFGVFPFVRWLFKRHHNLPGDRREKSCERDANEQDWCACGY